MSNRIYIYLKGEEELGEIIEKIRGAKEKEVVLVVPKETKALLHPLNLDILKKEITSLNRRVYLDTDDEKLINLAYHHKLTLFLVDSVEQPIIDIRPPKIKKEAKKEEVIPKSKLKFKPIKFNFGLFLKYFFSLVFISGISFFIWYVFQVRSEIYIETDKMPIELTEVVSIKEGILSSDYENKILAGEYKSESVFRTEVVTTTGKVFIDEKPLLKVVFLNYLEKEVPLKIGTQLLFQGNLFRTTERIIISSASGSEPGRKETTAFLDILEDENLIINKDNDLKIVKLEGVKMDDGRYWTDVIKAKVNEDYAITSTKPIRSVASEDITNVKLVLEKSLKSAIQTSLALKYPESFYYFDPSLVKIEIKNISHQIGDKTDQISATGKATYETMIVSKKELDNFIRNLINQKILTEKKNLIIKNLNIEKIDLLDFDSRKKIMLMGISIKADLMPDLSPELLKEKVKNQNLAYIQDYFSKLEGVTKVRIKIFPQWKENFPKDIRKIKIIIQ